MALSGIGNGITSIFGTSGPSSSGSGSISNLVGGLMDSVFGPQLNPTEPPPPIDRDFEVQPHVIQWPPQDQGGSAPADDGGGSTPQVPPQGTIPCTAVLSPPNSPDPLSCAVNVPDPNGGDPNQAVIPCTQVINQGDNSYCQPDMNALGGGN